MEKARKVITKIGIVAGIIISVFFVGYGVLKIKDGSAADDLRKVADVIEEVSEEAETEVYVEPETSSTAVLKSDNPVKKTKGYVEITNQATDEVISSAVTIVDDIANYVLAACMYTSDYEAAAASNPQEIMDGIDQLNVILQQYGTYNYLGTSGGDIIFYQGIDGYNSTAQKTDDCIISAPLTFYGYDGNTTTYVVVWMNIYSNLSSDEDVSKLTVTFDQEATDKLNTEQPCG